MKVVVASAKWAFAACVTSVKHLIPLFCKLGGFPQLPVVTEYDRICERCYRELGWVVVGASRWPVIVLGPTDVTGQLRHKWEETNKNQLKQHLIFYYGAADSLCAYGFMSPNQIIPYQDGVARNWLVPPKKIRTKVEGNRQLTSEQRWLYEGLLRIEAESKLPPERRFQYAQRWEEESNEDSVVSLIITPASPSSHAPGTSSVRGKSLGIGIVKFTPTPNMIVPVQSQRNITNMNMPRPADFSIPSVDPTDTYVVSNREMRDIVRVLSNHDDNSDPTSGVEEECVASRRMYYLNLDGYQPSMELDTLWSHLMQNGWKMVKVCTRGSPPFLVLLSSSCYESVNLSIAKQRRGRISGIVEVTLMPSLFESDTWKLGYDYFATEKSLQTFAKIMMDWTGPSGTRTDRLVAAARTRRSDARMHTPNAFLRRRKSPLASTPLVGNQDTTNPRQKQQRLNTPGAKNPTYANRTDPPPSEAAPGLWQKAIKQVRRAARKMKALLFSKRQQQQEAEVQPIEPPQPDEDEHEAEMPSADDAAPDEATILDISNALQVSTAKLTETVRQGGSIYAAIGTILDEREHNVAANQVGCFPDRMSGITYDKHGDATRTTAVARTEAGDERRSLVASLHSQWARVLENEYNPNEGNRFHESALSPTTKERLIEAASDPAFNNAGLNDFLKGYSRSDRGECISTGGEGLLEKSKGRAYAVFNGATPNGVFNGTTPKEIKQVLTARAIVKAAMEGRGTSYVSAMKDCRWLKDFGRYDGEVWISVEDDMESREESDEVKKVWAYVKTIEFPYTMIRGDRDQEVMNMYTSGLDNNLGRTLKNLYENARTNYNNMPGAAPWPPNLESTFTPRPRPLNNDTWMTQYNLVKARGPNNWPQSSDTESRLYKWSLYQRQCYKKKVLKGETLEAMTEERIQKLRELNWPFIIGD